MDLLDKLLSNDPRFTHLDLRGIYVSTEQLKAIADALEKNTFINRVSWDTEWLYYKDDLVKKIEDRVKLNNLNFERHPNDFVHGLLSLHVYTDSTQGDKVEIKGLEADGKAWNEELRSWKVYKVFDYPKAGRYYSAAYINQRKKQIVLAHRGTSVTFRDIVATNSPLKTDLKGILDGEIVPQQEKAFDVTRKVMDDALQRGYNISFTGHSLGAWLAELGLYFAVNDFKYFQSKAVTFDSPGSASTLKSFKSSVINSGTKCNVRNLNITTYLSAPNFVNVCNPHIGKAFRVFPSIVGVEYTQKLGNIVNRIPIIGDNIEPILNGLLSILGHLLKPILATFDLKTGKPTKFKLINKWPCIQYQPKGNTVLKEIIKGKIKEKLENVPVLGTIPGIEIVAYKVLSATTIGTVLEVVGQLLNGNINCPQYWKLYACLKDPKGVFTLENTDTLPKDQFDLSYEMHYEIQEFNPLKDVHNNRNDDRYLHQLRELSYDEIGQKKIPNNIKLALKNLKEKYVMKFEDNKEYICCVDSSGIPVDSLREEIIRLSEVYREVKDILEDKNAHSSHDPHNKLLDHSTILSNLPHSLENIVERPEVFEDIGRILKEQKCLVINSFAGTGKSTIAKAYGRYIKENYISKIVMFIDADSAAKINVAYKKIAENEFNIDIKDQTAENVMWLVHSRIANLRPSMLFIFDNVKRSVDIKMYLGGISNIESSRIIITTKNENLSFELKLKNIKLNPFTREEAKLYVMKNSAQNRFSMSKIDYLLDNIESNMFVLPYSLSHHVAYLNKETLCTVERYIEDLQKSGDTTGTYLLLDLINRSDLSWHILQYSAYLDPDFISMNLLKDLLCVDEDRLQGAVNKLEVLSLMNLRRLEKEQCGLQIHRLVQGLVKKYSKLNKHLESTMDEQNIFEKLLDVLNKLFPLVSTFPNEDWQVSQVLYPHAVKVVKVFQNENHCNKLAKMSELCYKLGFYNHNVACDFFQSSVHHEQALAIRREIYKNSNRGNHHYIVDSLYHIGRSYEEQGCIKKALKYYKNGLIMTRVLYKYQDHPVTALFLDKIEHTYRVLGCIDEASRYGEKYLEMRKALCLEDNSDTIAYFLENYGLSSENLRNSAKELKYFEDFAEKIKALYSGQKHPDIADALENLGFVNEELGIREEELKYHKDALEMRISLYPGQNCPCIANSFHCVAAACQKLGYVDEAFQYQKKALKMTNAMFLHKVEQPCRVSGYLDEALRYNEAYLEMKKRSCLEQNDPNIANSLENVELAGRKLSYSVKKLKYFEVILEKRISLYSGQKHPGIADALENLGFVKEELGISGEELKYHKDALEMRRALYPGQNRPCIAYSSQFVAAAYQKLGYKDEAFQYQEKALKITNALFLDKVEHSYRVFGYLDGASRFDKTYLEMRKAPCLDQYVPNIAFYLGNFQVAGGKLGNEVKQLKYFEDVLERRKALYPGQIHPDIADALENLGFVSKELGIREEELKYHKDALDMRLALYPGQNRPSIAYSCQFVAAAYQKLGYKEEAFQYQKKALKMTNALFLDKIEHSYQVLMYLDEASRYSKIYFETMKALCIEQNNPNIVYSLRNIEFAGRKLRNNLKKLKYFEDVLEKRKSLYPGQNHPDIADALADVGYVSTELGIREKKIKYHVDAYEMRRELFHGRNRPCIVYTSQSVAAAAAYPDLNNPDEPLQSQGKALMSKYAWFLDHVELWYGYPLVGLFSDKLRYDEAYSEMKKTLCFDQSNPNITYSLENFELAGEKLKRNVKKLKYFEDLLERRKVKYPGQNHPDIANTLENLGFLNEKLENSEEELKYHKDALEMRKALYPGQKRPCIAYSLQSVGTAYQKLGFKNEAFRCQEKALEMIKALFPEQNHYKIAIAFDNFAFANGKLGNNFEELKHYKYALEMRKVLYPGKCVPQVAYSYEKVGTAYTKLGNLNEALTYYKASLKMRETLYETHRSHVSIIKAMELIGVTYIKLRNVEKALKYLEQALELLHSLPKGTNSNVPIADGFKNLGVAYNNFGDIQKSAEYFKQSYLIAGKIFVSSDSHGKHYIEVNHPEFVKNNETRELIIQRGSFHKSTFYKTLKIKKKLQEPVLNLICDASSEGKWSSGYFLNQPSIFGDWGVKGYLDESYLRCQLENLSCSETIDIAKMLCFEAICLGIMGTKSKYKNFTCAKEFAKAYPKILEKIINVHPEYFVDGSILRQCTEKQEILNKLLGRGTISKIRQWPISAY